ncbi:MAG TPA: TolC family protein [Chthoniobacterales bacterium]|nr:TolC family protein [Chthoniobacterales bacterium]
MKFPFAVAISVWSSLSAASAITLDETLKETLDNNPAIQQAKLKVEAATGRRLVFRSVAWPNAKLNVPGGVQGGDRAGSTSTKLFGFVRGALTQPLFDTSIPHSLNRGDIEVLIAEQQLNLAVEDQLHTARVAFYTALYQRELRALREKQRLRLDENVASQSSRYQAGLVDRGAFTTATVEARGLDPMIEDSQRRYSAAQLQLGQSMAKDLKANAPMPEPEGQLTFATVNVDLNKEINTALEDRTDIKLARLLIRAANEDERIIAAGYYPSASGSITGDYIPVSGIHREGSTSRTQDFTGSEIREGAAFTWRVIDSGKVGGAVLRARSAREINEIELKKLEASVGQQLSRIRNQLNGIAERHNALISGATNAEQAAAAVQQNLGSGLASQLEYRVAESSYLKTQTGLLEASYLQNVALADWDRATGRYFQLAEDMR